MKKTGRIFLTIAALIILVIAVFIGIKFKNATTPGNPDKDGYSANIDYLNENVSILVYGTDINFREKLQYETISKMDENSMNKDADNIYLLINDLDAKAELTQSDVTFLKSYADKNNNFNFFYIGTDKLKLFTESGIFTDFGVQEDEMSFGYVITEGTRMTYSGAWSGTDQEHYEKNEELLGEILADTIARITNSND